MFEVGCEVWCWYWEAKVGVRSEMWNLMSEVRCKVWCKKWGVKFGVRSGMWRLVSEVRCVVWCRKFDVKVLFSKWDVKLGVKIWMWKFCFRSGMWSLVIEMRCEVWCPKWNVNFGCGIRRGRVRISGVRWQAGYLSPVSREALPSFKEPNCPWRVRLVLIGWTIFESWMPRYIEIA